MRFLADLHIHSHYSISTSRELTPPHLEAWARRKGITVLGTGDFTHPGWLAELEDHLEAADAEPGLFRLKRGGPAAQPVRFLLSAEISNIYRQDGRTRKVHNLIFAPDLQTARRLQRRLSALANLASDGRPIIGASSRDLLELALECDERILFVPAHIWTPWFSALGDKSGFDSIEECYGELSREIRAVETGLSSDPPMNWLCSFLDRYTLISNSDAHSPEKLGRECNLFDCELSYAGIAAALRRGDPGFLGTVEFFPEEGKYHHDGHRTCGVRWDPAETLRRGTTCPVCGKLLTVGVLNRVARLADREALPDPATRPSFRSLIPLKEILAEIAGVGAQSRQVERQYEALLGAAGPELPLLMEVPAAQLERCGGELLAEAVRRMRAGEVLTEPGYDGQYGRIRLFAPGETRGAAGGAQELLFAPAVSAAAATAAPGRERRALLGFDFAAYRAARRAAGGAAAHAAGTSVPATARPAAVRAERRLGDFLASLNPEQRAAAAHEGGPALVLAGPGTGKTHTLTARVAFLLEQTGTPPQDGPRILALTFTHKAAREIRLRLEAALGQQAMRAVRVGTFHSFGLELLRDWRAPVGELPIIDEQERLALLASLPGSSPRQAHRLSAAISRLKQDLVDPAAVQDVKLREACAAYQAALEAEGLLDLDDLVRLPVLRLQGEPALLESWQERLGSVLVDEYQDVNHAQYRLLRLLAPGATLWAVGDPNQAIYGFRGADVRYIERFREDYPDAAVYALPRSYRCSDTILQASAQMLDAGAAARAPTPAGRGPTPSAQPSPSAQPAALHGAAALQGPEPGVPLQLVSESSDRSEAEFVARTIEDMLGGLRFFSLDSAVSAGEMREGIGGLADFAVLCRTSRQMPALEQAFRDHAIPYRKAAELPFFKQEPSRSLLAALRKALRGEGASLRQLPVREALERLLQAAGRDAGEPKREELAPLLDLAAEFGSDWRRFLELTALGGPADGVWAAEQVSLLTLHAAKGLEWPCVFIVGCEEGLLPYTLFGEQERQHDEAEERRLFYVGMTRARRFLYLTRATRRTMFGRELSLPPSRYLAAIQDRLAELRQPAASRRPPYERDRQLELFSRDVFSPRR